MEDIVYTMNQYLKDCRKSSGSEKQKLLRKLEKFLRSKTVMIRKPLQNQGYEPINNRQKSKGWDYFNPCQYNFALP